MESDQNAHIGAVCSGSTLFASIFNSSVMIGNYLQQTTSADDIFRCIFLGALRVKPIKHKRKFPLLLIRRVHSNFRILGRHFSILFKFLQAISGDPDQTSRSVASDMGLHYLSMSHREGARLKCNPLYV